MQLRQSMVSKINAMSSKVNTIDEVIMVGDALELSTNVDTEVNTQTMVRLHTPNCLWHFEWLYMYFSLYRLNLDIQASINNNILC